MTQYNHLHANIQLPNPLISKASKDAEVELSASTSFRLLLETSRARPDPPVEATQSPYLASTEDMLMATPPSISESDTSAQRELPATLPTPARTLGKMALQSLDQPDSLSTGPLGNTDEQTISALTKEMSRSRFHLEARLKSFTVRTGEEIKNLNTVVTNSKADLENEMEKMLKGMKTLVVEEVKKQNTTQLDVIRFMVEQLQQEVQQDLRNHHDTVAVNHGNLSQKMDHCIRLMDEMCTSLSNLQARVLQEHSEQDIKMQALDNKIDTSFSYTNSLLSHVRPVSTHIPPLSAHWSVSHTPQSGTTKTDLKHLKLSFPTYGRSNDDPDPVLYLSKCRDFLAVRPLSDPEILAAFRTVLHGTARDWWEIAMTEVVTWVDFEKKVLSAFLSDDYQEELTERVRSRKQGERESIRDFSFSYRALCKLWKPEITEMEIVKMILKNIKPQLASYLRGRAQSVEELVKLGHQLEKDLDDTHCRNIALLTISTRSNRRVFPNLWRSLL